MKKFIILLAALAVCLSVDARPRPKHVIMIGIDGWTIGEFEKVDMQFVRSLQQSSAWTFDKRTVIPSASAINWESIFTATPPEYHGYTKWNSVGPDFTQVKARGRDDIPTIFRLVREKYPAAEIGVFYTWKPIKDLVDSTAVNDIRRFESTLESDRAEVVEACEYMKEKKPKLALFYFGSLDHTGHVSGFQSEEYRTHMLHIDQCIAGIFQGIKDAGIENDTVVILTSDHGGFNKAHGGQYVDPVMQTPLFIYGKGVRTGQMSCPSIEMDVAATIAWLLGIKPLDNWTGKPLKEAFK